jgi:SAM-dependent methyltransferase
MVIQPAIVQTLPSGFNLKHRSKKVGENPMEKILEYIQLDHPRTYALLDKNLINDSEGIKAHCAEMEEITGHSDFDGEEDGGRGRAYRENQLKTPLAREVGDRKILQMIERCPAGLSKKANGVDVIGGNGTTARVARQILDYDSRPYIISADPCRAMVLDCLMNQELPAVWQAAQSSLFSSSVLDFVLGTRGLHHVDRASRPALAQEAYRVLKPGGLIILIDCEENTPSADWYSKAVDRYTTTGHRFDHFTRAEFQHLLVEAGFTNISVMNLYDPFVFYGSTWEAARNALLAHLTNMFGLVGLERNPDESDSDFWDRVQCTLSPYSTFTGSDIAFDPDAVNHFNVRPVRQGVWRAEYPRIVLCATGFKPL